MNQKLTIREWLPLIGMTVAAFIFNTSEFMPIGLLTDIADDFQITEAKAGMLISAYSWAVMLLSLPLMLLASRISFRKLLLGTIALFGIGQVLSAVATGYAMLMAARIIVACAHAVFWSIASPAAVKIVPEKFRSFAMSMVVTGTSIAMIFGLPLGRIVGLYVGWRMTFFCVAVVAFLALIYMAFVFPKVEGGTSFKTKELPVILKNQVMLGIILMSFLVAGAYYTGYSYIEPFLKQVAMFKDNLVTITLMLFGAAGILGSFLFSCVYDKHRYHFIRASITLIAVVMLCLKPASKFTWTMILICMLWGMAVTAFSVTFQSETIKAVPEEASAVAMSMFSGIYNLGIGCGTWIGGLVCTHASMGYIGFAGGIMAVIAILYCSFILIPQMKRK